MRELVLEAEHILDGSWTDQAEEITNAEVGSRFDSYLERLSAFVKAEDRSAFVKAEGRTEDEKLRLGHLLKVLTHLRSGLVQCYDIATFPRTNNDMEYTIRAFKMHYRRISGAKTETIIFYAMDGVSPIKNGGCTNLMEKSNCKLVYDM